MTTGLGGLDDASRKRIQDLLAPGERLIWVGKPGRRHIIGHIVGGTIFAAGWLAISLPICAFVWASVLGLVPAKPGRDLSFWGALPLAAFSTLFPLIGLGILAGLVGTVRSAILAVHAVTDRRLVTTCGQGGATHSVLLSAVTFVRRMDHRDGRGSLTIGYGVERDSDGDPRAITTQWSGLADARAAERAILDTQHDVRQHRKT